MAGVATFHADDAGAGNSVRLCRHLLNGGLDHQHFCTLNKPCLTLAACRESGVAENDLAT